MRADELLPCRGGLALGGRWEAMALQDAAHRLGTDGVPEVREGAHDPVIAPGAILLGHAHDQGLQLWVNGGTPWDVALCGAITLLGYKCAVPAEDRLGLDDGGDVLQGLLSQLLANLREGLTFGI